MPLPYAERCDPDLKFPMWRRARVGVWNKLRRWQWQNTRGQRVEPSTRCAGSSHPTPHQKLEMSKISSMKPSPNSYGRSRVKNIIPECGGASPINLVHPHITTSAIGLYLCPAAG